MAELPTPQQIFKAADALRFSHRRLLCAPGTRPFFMRGLETFLGRKLSKAEKGRIVEKEAA